MGIYIKEFRKPTYCQECPLTFDYDCMIQHEQRDSLIDQYKHCPLVEVKAPHGRLIDARKWHKRLQKQAMTLYESDNRTYGLIMDIMDAIHTEPTVIEAEVE